MRGVILGVHEGRGILTTEDQRRLEFTMSEWRSFGTPVAGESVDFVEDGGEALAVYRVTAQATPFVSPPSSMPLGVIAVVCLALGFVIPFVPTIAALIVGLIGAEQARRLHDDNGLVLSRIGWIGAAVMLSFGLLCIMLFFAFFTQLVAAWAAMAGLHWNGWWW